jgi:hypothetical protein
LRAPLAMWALWTRSLGKGFETGISWRNFCHPRYFIEEFNYELFFRILVDPRAKAVTKQLYIPHVRLIFDYLPTDIF